MGPIPISSFSSDGKRAFAAWRSSVSVNFNIYSTTRLIQRREIETTMAKELFARTKPHVNVGTIGHIDHGKTTLTGAILAVQGAKGLAKFKSYADIAKGGTVRDATKTVTIAVSHVEYRDGQASLRPHRLPGPRRLHQEHDHRRRPDGRCDSGGFRGRRPDAANPRTRLAWLAR